MVLVEVTRWHPLNHLYNTSCFYWSALVLKPNQFSLQAAQLAFLVAYVKMGQAVCM